MKKKGLIYLLTLLMAFSPAAVFADAVDGAEDEGTPIVMDEEVTTEDPEAVVEGEEALPAEQGEAVEAEEAAAPEAAEQAEETSEEPVLKLASIVYGGNEEVFWADAARTKAIDKDGNEVHGLFKAQRKVGKLGLYYADESGIVVSVEGLVKPTEGNQFTYTKVDGETGWTTTGGGSFTYLIKNHDGDYYITNVEEDIVQIENGNKYYVKNGRVRTDAGTQAFGGKTYYIKAGGEVQTTEGFTDDHKYYVKSDGTVNTTKGAFKAKDGKTYFANDGGVIPSKEGFYVAGSNKYYVNSDGSVKTDAGFVTVDGKKYLIQSGGAIRNTAGPVKYGSNWYVSEAGGAIRTATGFYTVGATKYYVMNSDGVLRVNKAFKVNGIAYHATANGAIAVGVHKWGKYYYYSKASGAIRKKVGIVKWNGHRYHVKKSGKVTTNKKIKYKGKYYIAASNGKIYTRIFTWKKNMYYASGKGVLRTKAGVFTYDGFKYGTKKGGKIYRNTLFKIGSKKYLAQADGKLKFGYLTWNKNHYLTNSKYEIITKKGMYTYNKNQYYVKKGGVILVNDFVEHNDKYYYAGSDGAIVKKQFKAKGYTWHPNSKTGEISLEEYARIDPDVAPKEDKN